MTLALIVLVVFLIVWFNDSAKKKEQRLKRTKVKHCDEMNIPLQEETFLKWYNSISDEIEADKHENDTSMSLVGSISRRYLQYGIPCWDGSTAPSVESRLCGKELERLTLSIKTSDESLPKLNAKKLLKFIARSYDTEDQDVSYKEQYLNISNGRDWRLWLVHNELFCCNYKDWYKRNENIISYALFNSKIDNLFNALLDANLLQVGEDCILIYGRLASKATDEGGYYSPDSYSYIAPKDSTQKSSDWHRIIDSIPEEKYSRMEAILLDNTLRAYFLNLICLLTKKELSERGYGYSYWWDQKIRDSHLYIPTDEEAKNYPWLFA